MIVVKGYLVTLPHGYVNRKMITLERVGRIINAVDYDGVAWDTSKLHDGCDKGLHMRSGNEVVIIPATEVMQIRYWVENS